MQAVLQAIICIPRDIQIWNQHPTVNNNPVNVTNCEIPGMVFILQ